MERGDVDAHARPLHLGQHGHEGQLDVREQLLCSVLFESLLQRREDGGDCGGAGTDGGGNVGVGAGDWLAALRGRQRGVEEGDAGHGLRHFGQAVGALGVEHVIGQAGVVIGCGPGD